MSADRPLSPHLQAYKLPLIGRLSIAHRITGLLLSTVGFVLLVYWLVGLASGAETYAKHMAILSNKVFVLFYFMLTFMLFYHLCNGIRHLLWNIGYGFELAQANKASKIILIVSAVATLLFWILIV